MNSMVATETPDAAAHAAALPLETIAANERMRHIPRIEWIINKLESDVRKRADLAINVAHALSPDDARRADLEGPLRALCRAIDRAGDVVRHTRTNHAPNETGAHILWSIEHAVASLRTVDPETFGRRQPFHFFERSKSETLYGALLAVLCSLDRVLATARGIDPSIDEKLYAHLVSLDPAMRTDPIA